MVVILWTLVHFNLLVHPNIKKMLKIRERLTQILVQINEKFKNFDEAANPSPS